MLVGSILPTATSAQLLHQRRMRLMLWIGAGMLITLGITWTIFFGLRGLWAYASVDIAMVIIGYTVAVLTYRGRSRTAFFLLLPTALVLICGMAILLDLPTPQAPRSVHSYLLLLAVASLLFLRDENLFLRFGSTGVCLVAFVVLSSTPLDVGAGYNLPDSVRVTGTWLNNAFAAMGVYAFMHIAVAEIAEQSSHELELRSGIAKDQFFLMYQPQVNTQAKVVGAEGVLRWNHPRLGLVRPDDFIPYAEKTGLILPLGYWVIEEACKQLVKWSRAPDMSLLTLSVNVSGEQLLQQDFVTRVDAILKQTGAPAHKLKLELTESSLVRDMEDVIIKMHSIKALGIGFSLDDFGTGFSSLNYLKRLPLDQLKIDQSFVRDVLTDTHDASIARMVIALGKSLGLNVIAEGVETPGQREFLIQNDCNVFQGYLFSPPVPIAQFSVFCIGRLAAANPKVVAPSTPVLS
jgi:EAL domain-containing protein (putative c-di-GMP-specific phosphodiesterase class I)